MAYVSELISKDIRAYLHEHEHKSLLRFITCGSVDDGKSTLIGRLLFDSKMIFEDHMKSLSKDSEKFGTQGERIDFALLVDGLAAEREQGITIDVAYRFFSTDRRKFIVADTPGHEQYTRNMVTGASTADLAIVLIDARKGVLTQTKRHTTLVSLVGIKEIVLAINKMDLVNYDEKVYTQIVDQYKEFSRQLGIEDVTPIPISALEGDNITSRSAHMDWYTGPTLLGFLETVSIDSDHLINAPFRMPVQWVNRPNLDFRGFTGTIGSGQIQLGERIRVMPSGRESTVKNIVFHTDTLDKAITGQAVTLTLEDEIDVSRGDMICAVDAPATVADQFEAQIVWMSEDPLHPGRSYWLKCGAKTVNSTITKIKHQLNVNTLDKLAAENLTLNAVATCNISTDAALVFDPYRENRTTGGFILIDRMTNNTVAAGMIDFALRRAQNVVPHAFTVNKSARAAIKQQRPMVFWFTGISGSGKSTIANLFEQRLHAQGLHTYTLDGDNVRHGLNRDLGFTETDRVENIRRVAEVAKLMVDAGLIVLVTFISPFKADRATARALFEPTEFCEVFVDTPLSVAEQRDPKGLYKRARAGLIKNFTGIDSPYEAPHEADLVINTSSVTPEEAVALLESAYLKCRLN